MSELTETFRQAIRSAARKKVQDIADDIPYYFKEEQSTENTSRQENVPLQNFEGIKSKVIAVDNENFQIEIDFSALDDYNRHLAKNVYVNNVMKKARG